MMCSSIARPAPRPRCSGQTRIDLISPSSRLSRLSAPQPTKASPSWIVQNATSSACNADQSSGKQWPGGELACMPSKWCVSSAKVAGSPKSPRRIFQSSPITAR